MDVPPDWRAKVTFMREVGATSASWLINGELGSVELGPEPRAADPAPDVEPQVYEPPVEPQASGALVPRRRGA